jgi:hypothetical protein
MAIARINSYGEIQSRLYFLSVQTLSLIERSKDDYETDSIDLMNLNGFYRFLENIKSGELINYSAAGVVEFKESNKSFHSDVDLSNISDATELILNAFRKEHNAEVGFTQGIEILQQTLVSLAGLSPKDPHLVNQDLVKKVLQLIKDKLKGSLTDSTESVVGMGNA